MGSNSMYVKNKFILSVFLTFVASTSVSFADETVWVFETDKTNSVVNSGNNFGNQLSIDTDTDGTADLTIQAWSDTGDGWFGSDDNEVEQGYASTNDWGLLNYNLDSPNGTLTGEDHTIDNNHGDVDMMLFSFTESTSLIGIELGWAQDSDISIAAFSSLPSLSGNTWTEIVTQSIFTASFNDIGTGPYSLANELSSVVVEAQYWLIGAYTSIFENLHISSHNDAFKIASITTETLLPPTEVAEPSTIAAFASFCLFLMWRRKRSM
jgi:hypothetical protein